MKTLKDLKIDPSRVRDWRDADEQVDKIDTGLKQKFDTYPERYGAALAELSKLMRMYGRLKQDYDNLREEHENLKKEWDNRDR